MDRKQKSDATSLDALLRNNHQAKDYFMSLGEGAMGKLCQKGSEIHSYEDLVKSAEEMIY